MRKMASTIFSMGLGFCAYSAFAQPAPQEAIEHYLEKGRTVLNQLALGSPDTVLIQDEITLMLELTKPVLTAYGQVRPQCQEQLAMISDLLPEINSWEPLEIRRRIEAAQGLPQAQGCYPARDVVAHPAIVRAIVRRGIDPSQQVRLVREMNEAVEHMEEIGGIFQSEVKTGFLENH